jgi:hypothetical protein
MALRHMQLEAELDGGGPGSDEGEGAMSDGSEGSELDGSSDGVIAVPRDMHAGNFVLLWGL